MKKSRRQALGQHFLKDKKALRKIVRLINPQPEDTLIEIGPGKGALTFLLTPKTGRVIAIEIDSRRASLLKERAPKNLQVLEKDILKVMDAQSIFGITGFPVYSILALGQLMALRKATGQRTLEAAQSLVMTPDIFRYFLCGKVACDWTIAAVTQMFDYRKGIWSDKITKAFDIPTRILPRLVKPGTVVGDLLPEVAKETGIEAAPLIAVAGHDTPSAVATIRKNTIFIE